VTGKVLKILRCLWRVYCQDGRLSTKMRAGSTWGLVRAVTSVYHRYLNTETERDGGTLCFYVNLILILSSDLNAVRCCVSSCLHNGCFVNGWLAAESFSS